MQEEQIREILREIIREKGRVKKENRSIAQIAVLIGAAVIFCLTIIIQSDRLKENETALTDQRSHEYFNIVRKCISPRDWKSTNNLPVIEKELFRYDSVGQI